MRELGILVMHPGYLSLGGVQKWDTSVQPGYALRVSDSSSFDPNREPRQLPSFLATPVRDGLVIFASLSNS